MLREIILEIATRRETKAAGLDRNETAALWPRGILAPATICNLRVINIGTRTLLYPN